MIRVGLNGFGRIGRSIARIISEKKDIKLVLINDVDSDIQNLCYLLKYDSVYGIFQKKISSKKNKILINNKSINFFSKKLINQVPWQKYNIDDVIDATGLNENVKQSKKLIKSGIKKVLITHSPEKNIDFYMVIGANEKQYNYRKHNVISASICDASALSPLLKEIDKKWNIENGFVTTLHSILSYQNLLDGSLKSISNPSHSWKDYSLGRSTMMSLIPKKTTSISAVEKCVPEIKSKLAGMSFRVPTNIVCASDISLKIKNNCKILEFKKFLNNLAEKNPKIYEFQKEKLVSIDHLGTNKSLIIDSNYAEVLNSKFLKVVIWYDNERGYSSRVVDIVKLILKK